MALKSFRSLFYAMYACAGVTAGIPETFASGLLTPIPVSENPSGVTAILRYSKKSCEIILQPLVDPKNLIQAGLKTLSNADGPKTSADCLSEGISRLALPLITSSNGSDSKTLGDLLGLMSSASKSSKNKSVSPPQPESNGLSKSEGVNEKYALRRLLARYQASLLKFESSVESLARFCRENETSQHLDAAYASAIGPLGLFKSEKDWNFVRYAGFSEAATSILRDYTVGGFNRINGSLWTSKGQPTGTPAGPREKLEIEILNSALAEAVPYRATAVRRFSTLPADVLEQHQPGATITYNAFTSTSKSDTWNYDAGNRHSFLIYPGNKGVDIEKISSLPLEREVLFRAGTRFKVLSRTPRAGGDGQFDFVMAEVDDDGNVIAEVPGFGDVK